MTDFATHHLGRRNLPRPTPHPYRGWWCGKAFAPLATRCHTTPAQVWQHGRMMEIERGEWALGSGAPNAPSHRFFLIGSPPCPAVASIMALKVAERTINPLLIARYTPTSIDVYRFTA